MKRLFMLVLPAIWLAWQIPLVAQRDSPDGSGIPDGGGEAAWEPDLPSQVRLDIDSIELPHEVANALIRGQSGAFTGGTKVRELALQRVATGQGKRLHRQLMTIRVGQRSRSESIQEYPHPTEFDPGGLVLATKPGPPELVELFNYFHATPQSFEFTNLGWNLEAEVSGNAASGVLDLNLAQFWRSLVGEQAWGREYAEIKLPVFHRCEFNSKFPIRKGEWTLAALLRRPNPEKEGVGWELVPDRVLTFVRAMWEDGAAPPPQSSPPPKPRVSPPPSAAGILHEWIELPNQDAAALLAKYPAAEQSGSLRKELQERLSTGRANLLETGYQVVPSGETSLIRSVIEIENSAEQGPPQGGGGMGDQTDSISNYKQWFFSDLHYPPHYFETAEAGTKVEVELHGPDGAGRFDIRTQAGMVLVAGLRCHASGSVENQRLEFVRAQPTFHAVVPGGQPRLVAALDALPPSSLEVLRGPVPEKTTGKTLLIFVTALP